MTATRFSSLHIAREGLNRKKQKALKFLHQIFESASTGDTRELPVKKLTPRTSLNVPEGTTFFLEEELLAEFLKYANVKKREPNERIGSITMHGKTHEFYFFDFETVLATITKDLRRIFVEAPERAQLELLMLMYLQGFPYEESEYDKETFLH